MFWDRLKPNVLYITTLAFLAAVVTAGILLFGAGSVALAGADGTVNVATRWPIEILIILATAFGGSIVLFAALAGQVATDNPPNHHKDLLDYFRERDRMELEASTVIEASE